jgi:hypothetical protein
VSRAREGETGEHLNRTTLTEQQQKWIKLLVNWSARLRKIRAADQRPEKG